MGNTGMNKIKKKSQNLMEENVINSKGFETEITISDYVEIMKKTRNSDSLYALYLEIVWNMDSFLNNGYLCRKFREKLKHENINKKNGIELFEEYKYEMGNSNIYDLDATIFLNLIYLSNHLEFQYENKDFSGDLRINEEYFNNVINFMSRDGIGTKYKLNFYHSKKWFRLRGETLTSGEYYYNKYFNECMKLNICAKECKDFEKYMFNIGRRENYILQNVQLEDDGSVSENNINTTRKALYGYDRIDFYLQAIYNYYSEEKLDGTTYPSLEVLEKGTNQLWLNQFGSFEKFVEYHSLNIFVKYDENGMTYKKLFVDKNQNIAIPKSSKEILDYFRNFNRCFEVRDMINCELVEEYSEKPSNGSE